ncbi:phosphoadenosine phosphosulfate reductase [Phaeobacter sp. HF9A]|uniref:phosphoadenosine phosphosulfate reductase n=1 Tax=Phaeobacter sp. HF9A TaxID=2721561 RepID=UPI0014318971|nr:phosphoadenosine phosphosulfate reductase [Phaeobacter sp. HF9A]NIZ14016.1 phosphoadenosine phosphosulfate reductase [Phaeobacter sp. HF9A]
MHDETDILEQDLTGMKPLEWQASVAEIAEEVGMYQPLGKRHFAAFIDQGNTLLVTFESRQGIHLLSDMAQPLGFELVKDQGWSHLCLVSDGDTWFRDERVYGFFDQLVDDGFFEEFDSVLFYGAGPCGYAAAAYSVAAPGARVVAVQPQATLDPEMAGWDDRFSEMRKLSFTDRYGYAPDMLDAAQQAFVIYDPYQPLDAMHAALFARSNVTRLKLPCMGDEIQTRLLEMDMLFRSLSLAGTDALDAQVFYQMARARRDNNVYLKNLLTRVDRTDRPYLTMMLCQNVNARRSMPRFRRRAQHLAERAAAGEIELPELSA